MTRAWRRAGRGPRTVRGDALEGKRPRDTITRLTPYSGPLMAELEGAQIAEFAIKKSGMTIERFARFRLIARMGTKND